MLLLLILIPLLSLLFFFFFFLNSDSNSKVPKSYPLVGSFFAILANRKRLLPWLSGIMQVSPSTTFVLQCNYSTRQVFSDNPNVVQHNLKTKFSNYEKGHVFNRTLTDFLGHGIFNIDGDSWKFQRQVSSHEFNTKSLHKFIETIVDTELSNCLIPILSSAAKQGTVLDFQDILQRFGFDNILREFALNIIKEKKQRLEEKESFDSVDLLSRFLSSGHSDENFVIDIVISFITAGRDSTSAALTWFFWLLSKNPKIEFEILNEINEKLEAPIFDEVKDMVYTHASLYESMRLYPPVSIDTKEAVNDDVLPGRTVVKKGMRVTYFPYAMGRLEMLWGSD
ncbi:hypothetical protein SO802_029467 [Lithocarpus litseifolius]|uniref:Cytochrome P450 n=1 Tax=Lithocarpus litseifolius TaxID=425828 RepID=A0AAW2BU92_9ROSI